MKKKAFTLQEVLITLGIIGVIAALTIPAITKMKPDENKVKFMKAYNALATLSPEIANDEAIYAVGRDANGVINAGGLLDWNGIFAGDSRLDRIDPIYFKSGLFTKSQGVSGSGPSGPTKFGYFLSRRLNLNTDYSVNNNIGSFTTTDGISWEVIGSGISGSYTTNYAGSSNPTVATDYRNIITIDVNGDKAPNCSYNNDCQNPDRFVFYVYNYGNVEAADPLGKAFLLNSTNMNSKDEDRTRAKSL